MWFSAFYGINNVFVNELSCEAKCDQSVPKSVSLVFLFLAMFIVLGVRWG